MLYKNMLVYYSFDKTQVGLEILKKYKIRYDKAEDFVFLEGEIPSKDIINGMTNCPEKELFNNIRKTGDIINNYFVIINEIWTKQLKNEK